MIRERIKRLKEKPIGKYVLDSKGLRGLTEVYKKSLGKKTSIKELRDELEL